MTTEIQSSHRAVEIAGPAGRLEALFWVAPRETTGTWPLAAVACHPHPLYGGTMHNKVVFRVARVLDALGIPVLRFNFRGVGMSEGAHDKGRGEADDVRTALGFLAKQFPGTPLLMAGFSFGAWVGLRVGCSEASVAELVGLGLPANNSDLSFLRECRKPKLFIQGARDQYGSRAHVEALVREIPEPKRLAVVPGADHFFTGKLEEIDAALSGWLRERHSELKGARPGRHGVP